MEDLSKSMNKYVIENIQDSDIVREFIRCNDYKSVARQYNMNTNSVKAILKRAGIDVNQGKQTVKRKTDLEEIGMSEKDFYKE